MRDAGSIPGLGRSLRGGPGYPLWYSCLENPTDRRTCWATVQRIAKSQIQLKQFSTHACTVSYFCKPVLTIQFLHLNKFWFLNRALVFYISYASAHVTSPQWNRFKEKERCVWACAHLCLTVISWPVARQSPLSMEFFKQEYWSGLLFPTPGDLEGKVSNH